MNTRTLALILATSAAVTSMACSSNGSGGGEPNATEQEGYTAIENRMNQGTLDGDLIMNETNATITLPGSIDRVIDGFGLRSSDALFIGIEYDPGSGLKAELDAAGIPSEMYAPRPLANLEAELAGLDLNGVAIGAAVKSAGSAPKRTLWAPPDEVDSLYDVVVNEDSKVYTTTLDHGVKEIITETEDGKRYKRQLVYEDNTLKQSLLTQVYTYNPDTDDYEMQSARVDGCVTEYGAVMSWDGARLTVVKQGTPVRPKPVKEYEPMDYKGYLRIILGDERPEKNSGPRDTRSAEDVF